MSQSNHPHGIPISGRNDRPQRPIGFPPADPRPVAFRQGNAVPDGTGHSQGQLGMAGSLTDNPGIPPVPPNSLAAGILHHPNTSAALAAFQIGSETPADRLIVPGTKAPPNSFAGPQPPTLGAHAPQAISGSHVTRRLQGMQRVDEDMVMDSADQTPREAPPTSGPLPSKDPEDIFMFE